MNGNDRRLWLGAGVGVGVVVVALAALAWAMGWFGGGAAPVPARPAPSAASAGPPAVAAPAAPARTAAAGCSLPPDVLPVPLADAAAASAMRAGLAPDGQAAWIVSGLIWRCAETGSSSLDLQTPPEMGVTASAAVQMAITGVTLWPENEATETKPTAWRLPTAPTVRVKDPLNTDAGKNVLTLTWQADSSRIVRYQMAYTLYLNQKQ